VPEIAKTSRLLWAAIICSPLLWIAQLVLSSALTPALCRSHRTWVLHVITASFALVAGTALYFSARAWGRSAKVKPDAPTLESTERVAQSQFLSVVATMTTVFFLTLIIATGVPAIIIDPCAIWAGSD
jgi:hypothetical protein